MKNNYLNLNYRPKLEAEIQATYYMESKLGLTNASRAITAESSIGTWTKLSTLTPKTFDKLAPQIYYLNSKTKIAKISYPLELFELGSIPQLLSSLAGNIFSMKAVTHLRLIDLNFPKKYLNSFQGPALGIAGIRKFLKINNRPLVGSIIKPKIGLTAKEHARLAYAIWINGIDVVKDDENLTDLPFNRFEQRVKEVLKLKRLAEKQTNSKKVAVLNVTAPADIMLKRAKLVKQMGGECVMVDIVSTGLDNVQFLRKQNLGLIIHGHRAGHSMFSRDERHGMTMLVLAKLARLAGIDQLHTGAVVGKMDGTENEVKTIDNFLKSDWSKLKPVMPVASGGLHPGLTEKLVKILGNDLIINFGGGLHGHPDGSAAGARACWQSVEAVLKHTPAKKYALSHAELKTALEYWKI